MDFDALKQIFDELISSLEPLESQNTAILQLLKSKGLATDEELKPFLDQAANTASVRWLGVRVRTDALLTKALASTSEQPESKAKTAEKPVVEEKKPAPEKAAEEEGKSDQETKSAQGAKEAKAKTKIEDAKSGEPQSTSASNQTKPKPTAADEDKKQIGPTESQSRQADHPKDNAA